MIRGLASGGKLLISLKATYFLMPRPFSSVLVRELPHFFGSDFSPLINIPFLSADSYRGMAFLFSEGLSLNSTTIFSLAGLGMFAIRCLISKWS